MFTGIVESIGTVAEWTRKPEGHRLQIDAPEIVEDLHPGASISVDGVCLTIEDVTEGTVVVFLATETLERTALDERRVGDPVNLERAMPATGRFDGHLVQGHVDGTTTVEQVTRIGEDWRYTFARPAGLDRYLVEKGSVTLDGISLTVASVSADTFDVAIIPETYERTTISERRAGDPVHVEVDIIAKYVESMLAASSASPGR